MKKFPVFLSAIALIFCFTGVAGAVPQTVNFSEWPGAPMSFGAVDVDTAEANSWFGTNYGLNFSNVYMYWDSRDTFDSIGIATDFSGMPNYNGGIGYFYFSDTTDYVTVEWATIFSNDIYLTAFDASDNVLDTFFQAGNNTLSGTTTLNGSAIAYMTFHDDGGTVGISTLSYDFDGVTDGVNNDINPVPEPSTMLLLGSGLLGLVGLNRRRKA